MTREELVELCVTIGERNAFRARAEKLEAGLKEIIAHHELLNARQGRPRAHSHTIKIAEKALQ